MNLCRIYTPAVLCNDILKMIFINRSLTNFIFVIIGELQRVEGS